MSIPLQQARLLMDQKRYDLAAPFLLDHLRLYPEDVNALCSMATVETMLGRHQPARDWAQRAVARDPDEPWAYYVLGLIALRDHAYFPSDDPAWPPQRVEGLSSEQFAEQLFDQAIRLAPRWSDCFRLKAFAQYRQNKFNSALESLEQALALDPDNVSAVTLKSQIALHVGAPDSALAHAEQALALEPEHPDAHASRARALLRQERWREAVGQFENALRLDPHDQALRRDRLQAVRNTMPLYRWVTAAKKNPGTNLVVLAAFWLPPLFIFAVLIANRFFYAAKSVFCLFPVIALVVHYPPLWSDLWLALRPTRPLLNHAHRRAGDFILLFLFILAATIFTASFPPRTSWPIGLLSVFPAAYVAQRLAAKTRPALLPRVIAVVALATIALAANLFIPSFYQRLGQDGNGNVALTMIMIVLVAAISTLFKFLSESD